MVANYAAGRGSSAHGVKLEEVNAVLKAAMEQVRIIIENLVDIHDD